MSDHYFPASIYLIDVDPKIGRQPVVGFRVIDGGHMGMPVLLTAFFDGIKSGMGFQLHDGGVYDPVWNRTFTDAEEWREAVAEEEPYIPGKTPGVSGKDGKAPASMRKNVGVQEPKPAPPSKNGGRPGKALPMPRDGLVVMGKKTYKTASYWHYVDGAFDFVFKVNGGDPVPSDSCCTKIKRQEFFELRQQGTTEMALPQTEIEPGDDDDDDDDLI